MTDGGADAGSFRDPSGRVILRDGRVFRTVMPGAREDFDFVRNGGFLARQIAQGRVIDESRVDAGLIGAAAQGADLVLEHPRLAFVSYPYEWPFAALQAAALLQLDLCIEGLDAGVMLSDASAYNVQFNGTQPVFIDSLSFRRYREGEYWTAHRQFCEQFLNPLLLRSLCGIAHNAWYRGALEGIPTQELARILPLRSRLSWNVLTQVVLQAKLQHGSAARDQASRIVSARTLPRSGLRHLLLGLRRWVERLHPGDRRATTWANYADDNSYSDDETNAKREFVARFAAQVRPGMLWDIGCNTGAYSEVALAAGAGKVIGFDFDQGSLDRAFARARHARLDLLPLFLDAANPAPSQGWAQSERPGLAQRASADALLALAVVHHLAIARNVPLDQVVDWLLGLAPQGIIEFVQPHDPMVRQLLSLREDIFDDYNEARFVEALSRRARIVATATVSSHDRRLFHFERH